MLCTSANIRWYQHVLVLDENSDDLVPDRPFREAELDPDLVVPLECKAPYASINLKTVALANAAATVCCSWVTWLDLSRCTPSTRGHAWASSILSPMASHLLTRVLWAGRSASCRNSPHPARGARGLTLKRPLWHRLEQIVSRAGGTMLPCSFSKALAIVLPR